MAGMSARVRARGVMATGAGVAIAGAGMAGLPGVGPPMRKTGLMGAIASGSVTLVFFTVYGTECVTSLYFLCIFAFVCLLLFYSLMVLLTF